MVWDVGLIVRRKQPDLLTDSGSDSGRCGEPLLPCLHAFYGRGGVVRCPAQPHPSTLATLNTRFVPVTCSPVMRSSGWLPGDLTGSNVMV